jgi:hypothetical protein
MTDAVALGAKPGVAWWALLALAAAAFLSIEQGEAQQT